MGMAIPIGGLRWRRSQSTEATASQYASALCPRYRLTEDIGILAVVVAELELRQREWQVFLADVVVRADDPPLQECPKRIEVSGVNFTAHILALIVIDGFMAELIPEAAIARILVGRYKFNLVADGFANESFKCLCSSILDDLADDVAFAANRADNANLARPEPARSRMLALAVVMIPLFTANESLVNLDDPHKLAELADRALQREADAPCTTRFAAKRFPRNTYDEVEAK